MLTSFKDGLLFWNFKRSFLFYSPSVIFCHGQVNCEIWKLIGIILYPLYLYKFQGTYYYYIFFLKVKSCLKSSYWSAFFLKRKNVNMTFFLLSVSHFLCYKFATTIFRQSIQCKLHNNAHVQKFCQIIQGQVKFLWNGKINKDIVSKYKKITFEEKQTNLKHQQHIHKTQSFNITNKYVDHFSTLEHFTRAQ